MFHVSNWECTPGVHHLLLPKECISRKLKLEIELRLEATHPDVNVGNLGGIFSVYSFMNFSSILIDCFYRIVSFCGFFF